MDKKIPIMRIPKKGDVGHDVEGFIDYFECGMGSDVVEIDQTTVDEYTSVYSCVTSINTRLRDKNLHEKYHCKRAKSDINRVLFYKRDTNPDEYKLRRRLK